MRVALGADHAGVHLKEAVRSLLLSRGIEVQDFGTVDDASVDYPDYAALVGRAVAAGEADRGILACGTGLGMAIAANKIEGVRAAPIVDLESARLSREHNDANVLALGARVTSAEMALQIVATFIDTPFAGGRHQRRLDKIAALDHERHS
ncbi:ribose 5-phosphate isomerase B [Luteitalea sp.]|jgi:ribose 5-phosphate isomerase B|uniref:ribose 5-phosphate isomerase B n=1 Tax=Luteitalea sp. TaxID=2004800 RepID=UPI0037C6335C